MEHSESHKTIVILAGGLGSRYQGLKQTDALLPAGETLLEFSIFDAIEAGFDKFVLIVNPNISREYIERLEQIGTKKEVEMHFVHQEMNGFLPDEFVAAAKERSKPWGTGHAILTARSVVNEPFVVINADDFYGRESYFEIQESINADVIKEDQYEMIGFPVNTTLSDNGPVSRGVCTLDDQCHLVAVVEHTHIAREDSAIVSETPQGNVVLAENTLVSMNFWCFHPSVFDFLQTGFLRFLQKGDLSKAEFYIPTVIQQLIDDQSIRVTVHQSESEWMGLTYPEDKEVLQAFLLSEIKKSKYPKSLW